MPPTKSLPKSRSQLMLAPNFAAFRVASTWAMTPGRSKRPARICCPCSGGPMSPSFCTRHPNSSPIWFEVSTASNRCTHEHARRVAPMSENAPSRLARLLALVPWLRAHDGVTIQEAAEHFQVTPDQLTTDLWQLIVCGIPGYGPDQLVDIQFWDDDRIHVLDPMTLDRPLRLTGEEAAALVVAVRVLGQIPGEHDRAALRSAMSKLEMASAPMPEVDVRIDGDPSVVEVVSNAIAQSAGLQIEYASASTDSISRRVIAPRASFTVDGYAYLEAWCDLAQGIRTFRLDRIASATLVPSPKATGSVTQTPHEDGPSLVPPEAPSARIAVDPD